MSTVHSKACRNASVTKYLAFKTGNYTGDVIRDTLVAWVQPTPSSLMES